MALAVAAPGCIVTSSPTYAAGDDCPPEFLYNEADPPTNNHVQLDRSRPGTVLELAATVSVRSCAVTKALEGRVFIDGRIAMPAPVVPNGQSVRTAKFALPLAGTLDGCHLVEYLVTGRFASSASDFRTPEVQGDLTLISWWVDIHEGTSHAIGDCYKGGGS